MARASRGSGSYKRMPSGMWQYRKDGLQGTGRLQREALAAWEKKAAGRKQHTTDETVETYLRRWLAGVKPHVAYNTWRRYASTCTIHIIPSLGPIRLDLLTPRDVSRLIAEVLGRISANSAEKVRSTLSVALRDAVHEGTIGENPVQKTRPPRLIHHDVEPLTLAQIVSFLTSVHDDPLASLYIVTLSLGLRQGEALGLCWQDVDMEGGTAWIRHNLIRVGGTGGSPGHFLLGALKGKRSRVVNLPRVAIVALASEKRKGAPEHPWGLIFTSATGGPLHGSWVRRQFARAISDSGLPPQKFHNLRHTAASILAESGLSLKETQVLLGHANVGITGNIYVHIFQGQRQRAADMMDALLTGDASTSSH